MFNDAVNADIEYGRLVYFQAECGTSIPELMVFFAHPSQKQTWVK
jgi:hypothetical protein